MTGYKHTSLHLPVSYLHPSEYQHFVAGDLVEWLMRRTSTLIIASRMGSNKVIDKLLFP